MVPKGDENIFHIDLMSRKPIYEQLGEQTGKLILAGVLHPLDKMPSVRSLSSRLSVNPNTIQRAYSDLCARGLLTSMAGRGYYVTEDAEKILKQEALKKFDALDALIHDLEAAGIRRDEILTHIEGLPDTAEGGKNDD